MVTADVGVKTGFDDDCVVLEQAVCVSGAFLVPATAVVRGVLLVTVVVVSAIGVEML